MGITTTNTHRGISSNNWYAQIKSNVVTSFSYQFIPKTHVITIIIMQIIIPS
ncbi:hypothetical protein HanPI659440_Chr10g0376921 [Helianthus annuus]|nr:hypothetical protein HanPI659440_Chr10g0376921 [Helianthus annuus]